MDARAAVGAPTNRTPGQLLCPFDLQMWAIDRMLNFEITDDPDYEGLELQVFDDPAHGRGMAVLLRRRSDGHIDIYRQPGLTLDPEMAQVGGELGEWRETAIDPARFDISPDGIDVDVRLTDMAGRVIEVRIDDRDGRRRHRGTLLAPVGAVVDDPASLSLFMMGGCDLVRRSGPVCDLRIDGRPLATGRLPGGRLHRRRLIKYTADPMVVICNQAHDGPVASVDPRAPGEVELAPRSGGIGALRARSGGHRARLELAPASRMLPGSATDDRGRDLAARHRRQPGRGGRVLDRLSAAGPRRGRPRRRPGLAAEGAPAAYGGGHKGRPSFPQLAGDLSLVRNAHPR